MLVNMRFTVLRNTNNLTIFNYEALDIGIRIDKQHKGYNIRLRLVEMGDTLVYNDDLGLKDKGKSNG